MDIYKNRKFADAVFEGGGVKGIGLVGAFKTFEDNGYNGKIFQEPLLALL